VINDNDADCWMLLLARAVPNGRIKYKTLESLLFIKNGSEFETYFIYNFVISNHINYNFV
jgi:hypothetical protein